MKGLKLTKAIQRLPAARLGITVGLTLLFLAALLWGLRGVIPALADPGTLYVDGATGSDTTDCTNPAAPCETIGYALTQAGNGDEIRVAEGTYTETLDIAITVTLKGGYEATGWTRDIAAHPTIVDADGADNAVICTYPGANVTVEGFTVQGANHTSGEGGGFWVISANVSISDTVIRENSAGEGGGVFIEDDSNVSLINSTITANTVSAAGGTSGFSGGTRGHVMIQNTVFTENTGGCVLGFGSDQPFEITGGQVVSNTVSGFAVIRFSGSGTISGTAVLSNTSGSVAIDTGSSSSVSAHGLIVRNNVGGIASSGVLTITDSIIENNSGGTRAAVGSGNWPETNRLVMDGCTIRGNSTPHIVRITTGHAEIRNTKIVDNDPTASVIDIGEGGTTPTVEMINVLLADNETQQGFDIVNHVTGSAMLMNVTVARNASVDQLILYTNETMTVTNTIVWGNTTSAEDMLGGPGTLSVSYSDIEGGWPGAGNLDADPRFVDAANGDYHLQPDSPCVDTGTNTGAPDHDFEGDARPFAYGVDMGADEWWPMLSVTLSTDQAGEGPPGADVTYVFTVTNNGDYTDTFSLGVSGVWTPTLDVGITSPLASGGSSAVVLTVTIPPDAVNGASDVATLAATSGWSTAVSDSALATTTARWHKVYLPITLRNFGS